MKKPVFSLLILGSLLTLASCNSSDKRSDGTAGTAVTAIDSAAEKGGVKADATVIDNNAGPTVTANPDSLAPDSARTK